MMTRTGLLVPVHWDCGHLVTEDCYAVCLGSGEGHPHAWTTSASAALSLAMSRGVPFVSRLSVDLSRSPDGQHGEVISEVVEVTS